MSLIPWSPRHTWDPVDWMRQFQDDMNRFFDRSLVPASERRGAGPLFAPPVDMIDCDGEVVVRAELPGLDKEEVHVSLVGSSLSIEGEKKSETEEKKENYYRRERTYGSFQRILDLPDNVDGGKADASFKNGILEIRLPKREEAKPKQIEVKVK